MLRHVLAMAFITAALGVEVKIMPKKQECFTERAFARGATMKASFFVGHGGRKEIQVSVLDPRGSLMWIVQRQMKGSHEWGAHSIGDYKVCLENTDSFTPKWVSFEIKLIQEESAKVQHLTPLEEAMTRLGRGMTRLQYDHQRLRAVEKDHRDSIEEGLQTVLMWAIFEAILFVAVGFIQIYYLKRFLEIKSSI
eukprot:Rhum_TRINITY_DN19217_c0_g1::Rhum_TRINITY_DN19217_c0_g1_i1::g.169569::m.169569/K20347/TMED2, EMP24; p24 family protein beta-1